MELNHRRKWDRTDTIRQIEQSYATRKTCRYLGEYVGGGTYKFKGVYYVALPGGGIEFIPEKEPPCQKASGS